MFRPSRALLLLGTALLAACETYTENPIRAEAWLAELREPVPVPEQGISLQTAVAQMLEHNPALQLARQELSQARAEAAAGAPLANPQLGFAPIYLAGGGVSGSLRQGFELSLGWALPLWGTRGLRQAVLAGRAGEAQLSLLLALRQEYLQLRAELLRSGRQLRRVELLREDEALLRQMLETQKELSDRAQLNAVEQGLLALDLLALGATRAAAEVRSQQLYGELAARTGMQPAQAAALPQLVVDLLAKAPPLPQLRDALVEHPELLVLRAAHARADTELRLELRRQYPDLQLGAGYEKESGGHKYVLPLGVELPLFDRNQQGIAAARTRRDGFATQYRQRLRQLLHAQASAHAVLEMQRSRYRQLRDGSKKLDQELRRLLRSQVEAGQLNRHLRLEAQRRLQQAELQRQEAAQDLMEAWLELERACGAPLLDLPGAPSTLAPGAEEGR